MLSRWRGPRRIPEVRGVAPGLARLAPPPSGTVDVWWWTGEVLGAREDLVPMLDDEERGRLQRFRRRADAETFRARHVGLRLLLAGYLDTSPAGLRLGHDMCPVCGGAHGRPVVEPGTDLQFSVSSARQVICCAVATTRVGVDVERVPMPDVLAVLSLLNSDDRGDIEALPDHQRAEATTRCWVRSEAYLKGLGTGIARGLGETTVGVDDSRPTTVLGWSLRQLEAPELFAAALACEGGAPRVVRRSLDDELDARA